MARWVTAIEASKGREGNGERSAPIARGGCKRVRVKTRRGRAEGEEGRRHVDEGAGKTHGSDGLWALSIGLCHARAQNQPGGDGGGPRGEGRARGGGRTRSVDRNRVQARAPLSATTGTTHSQVERVLQALGLSLARSLGRLGANGEAGERAREWLPLLGVRRRAGGRGGRHSLYSRVDGRTVVRLGQLVVASRAASGRNEGRGREGGSRGLGGDKGGSGEEKGVERGAHLGQGILEPECTTAQPGYSGSQGKRERKQRDAGRRANLLRAQTLARDRAAPRPDSQQ